jgi:hypothetical protein
VIGLQDSKPPDAFAQHESPQEQLALRRIGGERSREDRTTEHRTQRDRAQERVSKRETEREERGDGVHCFSTETSSSLIS